MAQGLVIVLFQLLREPPRLPLPALKIGPLLIGVHRIDGGRTASPEPLEVIVPVHLTSIAVFLEAADIGVNGGVIAGVSDGASAGQVDQFRIILGMVGQTAEELVRLRPMQIAERLQDLVHALDVLLPAFAPV